MFGLHNLYYEMGAQDFFSSQIIAITTNSSINVNPMLLLAIAVTSMVYAITPRKAPRRTRAPHRRYIQHLITVGRGPRLLAPLHNTFCSHTKAFTEVLRNQVERFRVALLINVRMGRLIASSGR